MKKILTAALFFVMFHNQYTIAQEKIDTGLQTVVSNYIDLKNSLFAGSGEQAKTAGSKLFNAINSINDTELTATQLKVWKQYAEKLSYDAEHIKGTTEIEHQREHFIKLSENMYKFLKASGINSSELYYDFCPMANNGKGAYWISEEYKISIPYYGKKMATCGSVKDTLPPSK